MMAWQRCVVRHGPPQDTSRCYGWLDIALAEDPKTTAERLRSTLPTWALDPQTPLWSSPSERCLHLAQALANGRSVHTDLRLRELHFGAWEGQPWAEIQRTQLDAWAADPFGFQMPDGESVPEFIARTQAVWPELPAQSLIITHAGVIRSWWHLIQQEPLNQAFARPIGFGEAVELPPR
jgi:alpha-ribazole phosphatase